MMLFLAEGPVSLPVLLMLAGLLLLGMLLVINTRHRFNRNQQERITPHEKVERMKQMSGMRGDLREMMVELEELARRFSAQLEAKSIRLERLLDEADEKIQRLEQLRGQVGSGGGEGEEEAGDGVTGQPEPIASRPVAPPPRVVDPLTEQIYSLADEGRSSVDIARELDEHVGKVELILALRR